jgi:hypothetical protein
MKIRKQSADKFFYNQYRYRINVQSYVVLKPETCCPHRTKVNEKPPLDENRDSISSRDTKLVRDTSRWGAVTVYFNDISLVDDLTEMQDLLAFNLTECIIDT